MDLLEKNIFYDFDASFNSFEENSLFGDSSSKLLPTILLSSFLHVNVEAYICFLEGDLFSSCYIT